MSAKPNLVQIEFFLGNHQGLTEAFFHDLLARLSEGSRIKQVVRIFDPSGKLTQAVQKVVAAKEAQDQVFGKSTFEAMPVSRFAAWRIRRLARKLGRKKEKLHALAIKHVLRSAQKGGTIAVERPDHSFRLAEPRELHELAETVQKHKEFGCLCLTTITCFQIQTPVLRMQCEQAPRSYGGALFYPK
jgi:hypothetical protein